MNKDDIKGHTTAKRALEVALVGGHTVMLYGPAHVGKKTLASVFPTVAANCVDTCFCGNHKSVTKPCICTAQSARRYTRRIYCAMQEVDMVIEVCEVPMKEYQSSYCPDHTHMLERVKAAQAIMTEYTAMALDDAGERLREMACRRLSFTYNDWTRCMRVARTIACMDHSKGIQAKHVAEAVQYKQMTAHLLREWEGAGR
jgi:predicted ATPase with chaperone activity